jgi:hypothetical protein
MMNAYDLSYSVAYQHISDLRHEAAARRRIPPRCAPARKAVRRPFRWLAPRPRAC